ncbi:PREDICTED: uncharacterized protein LOC106804683 isoform X2 [Priapulus caudatus]|uniref:Uncharacterized protein LOC106804683 isoform X1 n=1 Tax=Priapulus caudatus TaxID=37621 RepID=A0ABM1DNC5_PRICU|nr:PREDICTED: uncharacterized protein LOC106804683 isoform X1 [Priapulus caudatus]XP_014661446.1 PREDICTED: uncharacterized protein LOC106804683 isoform X2 [Priapulus caudatus]
MVRKNIGHGLSRFSRYFSLFTKLSVNKVTRISHTVLSYLSVMADGCTIRDTIESDLPHIMKWWAGDFQEDFALETLEIMVNYGEGGGASTAVLPSGEPVGYVFSVVIGDQAFGGYFIVRSDMRGRGIGRMLTKRRLEHVGSRNFGINSVMERVEANKKLGFTVESFMAISRRYTVDHAKLAASLKLEDDANIIVKPYSEEMLQAVLDYDKSIAGQDRGGYLRPYIQAYKKLVFVTTDAKGKVTGFVIATNMVGNINYSIFPLYGDTEQVQKQLMRQVLMALPDGSEIGIYTPSDNIPATGMVEALGARTELFTKRLYTKHVLKLPLEKVASVLNLDVFII